ncbi:MAG TPA: choice-of-anchor B family protein, partial [Rubricoccaceae bacterium]|jgi:choice-of-anchor B domain-containing protein
VTGKEIALVGLSNGVGFVDVTAPEAPVYLGKLPSATTGNNSWRTFRVDGDYVYVGSEAQGHGVQVFSLARLRGVTAPQAFTADARYTRVSNVHTLVANAGFLYLAGSNNTIGATNPTCVSSGLHIVDVRNPLAPTYAGCYQGDGYTHEAQCLTYAGPDADYAGRELCFAYQGQEGSNFLGELTVVDMTNKAAPVRISTANYPSPGYSHQGWLTPDGQRVLINDEFDASPQGARTIVMDVEDLDDIGFLSNYYSPEPTYAHNLYTRGQYAYLSNYTSGLRIVDLAALTTTGTLTEVAHFDTYNQDDSREYEGQWMNYPYFASGTVVATDINNGFFVLRPTGLNPVAVEPVSPAAGGLSLGAPAPNPTASESRLRLTASEPQAVRAVLVDVLGREVAVLFDGTADGATDLVVRAGSLRPGTYVVRVTGERGAATRTVVVVR